MKSLNRSDHGDRLTVPSIKAELRQLVMDTRDKMTGEEAQHLVNRVITICDKKKIHADHFMRACDHIRCNSDKYFKLSVAVIITSLSKTKKPNVSRLSV